MINPVIKMLKLQKSILLKISLAYKKDNKLWQIKDAVYSK